MALRAAMMAAALAAAPEVWKDPSKHEVRFVDVDKDVRLEVLDWGGSGRPVVLLAGYGHSAHVFDDLAPRLTDVAHVYGITRRGFGASSHPESGYGDQRLADDVLAVLDALRLDKPVLAGHSLGGCELTTLGNQHSARLSGLVYLDALQNPRDFPGSDPAHDRLLQALPEPMRTPRCRREGETVDAYRKADLCNQGAAVPESELRATRVVEADGTVGPHRTPRHVGRLINEGQIARDYSKIRVPVLALAERPRPGATPEHYRPKTDAERAAILAFGRLIEAYTNRWEASLKKAVPDARFVDVGPGAGHFVFLTREEKVLTEMRAFLGGLRR